MISLHSLDIKIQFDDRTCPIFYDVLQESKEIYIAVISHENFFSVIPEKDSSSNSVLQILFSDEKVYVNIINLGYTILYFVDGEEFQTTNHIITTNTELQITDTKKIFNAKLIIEFFKITPFSEMLSSLPSTSSILSEKSIFSKFDLVELDLAKETEKINQDLDSFFKEYDLNSEDINENIVDDAFAVTKNTTPKLEVEKINAFKKLLKDFIENMMY
ncbi:hypothetical protein HZS_6728, partial [Henneguya salminicola]